MNFNVCCLIGLGACRSSLGRQGAEQLVPTEAPHHGPGAATRRRGVEPVVPPEAPQQRPGRRQPLRNFFTEASGTEQFLQAGLYFLLAFGVDFFEPSGVAKI